MIVCSCSAVLYSLWMAKLVAAWFWVMLRSRSSTTHQIAAQPIHRVTHADVAFPDEHYQSFELRALEVLTGGFI